MTQAFWDRVEVVGDWTSCWKWRGKPNAKGYGRFGKKRRLAHRIAYELSHGEIPKGLIVCHKCDNPPCVRPSHLWAGTHKDNVQDRIQKGRPGSTGRPRKFPVDATLTQGR